MASSPEWTIIYHGAGKFKGRGEFLRIMLEDKGVPYDYTDKNLIGPEGIICCFRGSPEKIKSVDNTPFPVFFPPAIHHVPSDGSEEVMIDQVTACLRYIGDVLGYNPSSRAERARADCITENANDYISEGRRQFHPVKDAMSYSDQKEEGDEMSKEWTKQRMLMWLAYFEKICSKNESPTSPIAGGPSVTYADFCLFQCLDATVAQFDNEKYDFAWKTADIPTLKEYYENFKNSRPNLKAYLESDRAAPYTGDSMM